MTAIAFYLIPYGSAEHEHAVKLREAILRTPLGLSFSAEELEAERNYIHVVGYLEGHMVATCALVAEGTAMEMRRVVVTPRLQGKGIGSDMLAFCETLARDNGFTEIFCHARDTAMAFYRKHGFITEGEMYEEDTVMHQVMRKKLV